MPPIKLTVGLEMLNECPTEGEHSSAVALLTRILANIAANPDDPKYRQLRASNPKIAQMLATKGVRAILIGSGFVDGAVLTMPADAPVDDVNEALRLLNEQVASRAAAQVADKQAELERRASMEKENAEERKRMKMQISDDAAARKEPGWKAKAAGVKEGKSITSCSDVGIGQSSGG